MIREGLSWLFYGIGHSIFLIFDRKWCGGMHWPIYKTYNWAMCLSDDIQGNGKGPWKDCK